MGKKQHSKDTLHIRHTEWVEHYGGKSSQSSQSAAVLKRLPYDHCALSLQPFKTPMCTRDGVIFDLAHIQNFLKQFGGVSPVTGEKLTKRDLVALHFHKNQNGRYMCPVTYKVFTESTHIVAIATSGNVYSKEAVDRLNIKPGNWRDLIDDSLFKRGDIIIIQDPSSLEKCDISNFYYVKNKLKLSTDKQQTIRVLSKETKDSLDEVRKLRESLHPDVSQLKGKAHQNLRQVADDNINAAHYSTGAVAASFTSTSWNITTKVEPARLEDDQVRYSRVHKKGYVRVVTSLGPLNLELDCDLIPKACENFIKLCKSLYYNDTKFHRSIRNFVLQGGDPTGTGHGGDSVWGVPFKDEFHSQLSHTGRGILSMANSGRNTNKSQFFITYRSCKHLDRKHTVFGRVVGGLDTLDRIEGIEVDKNDCPIEDIFILTSQVFVDPYEEVDQALSAERDALKKANEDDTEKSSASAVAASSVTFSPFSNDSSKEQLDKSNVGKFINLESLKRKSSEATSTAVAPTKRKKDTKSRSDLIDFSAW